MLWCAHGASTHTHFLIAISLMKLAASALVQRAHAKMARPSGTRAPSSTHTHANTHTWTHSTRTRVCPRVPACATGARDHVNAHSHARNVRVKCSNILRQASHTRHEIIKRRVYVIFCDNMSAYTYTIRTCAHGYYSIMRAHSNSYGEEGREALQKLGLID